MIIFLNAIELQLRRTLVLHHTLQQLMQDKNTIVISNIIGTKKCFKILLKCKRVLKHFMLKQQMQKCKVCLT